MPALPAKGRVYGNRTTLRVELRRKDSNLRDLFQRQAACHWLTPQWKSAREDSNLRPLGYQPSARPSELRAVRECDRPGRIRTDVPPLKRRMPWAAWLPACSSENCGGGIRTHGGRFNRAVPYQLGYATSSRGRGGGNRTRLRWTAYETAVPTRAHPRTHDCGGGTRTRTHLFTRQALCIQFELRRKDGPGGTRTLTRSLQDFYAAVTSPALVNDCGGGNRTRGRRFMRPLLCH